MIETYRLTGSKRRNSDPVGFRESGRHSAVSSTGEYRALSWIVRIIFAVCLLVGIASQLSAQAASPSIVMPPLPASTPPAPTPAAAATPAANSDPFRLNIGL